MNRHLPIIAGALLLVSALVLTSCKKNNTTNTSATCSGTISYSSTIKPLIDQNCATSGCHNSTGAGGYMFTTHASVSNNASIILKTIRHENGVQAMPQGAAKLSSSSADNFDCWIQQGKLNN